MGKTIMGMAAISPDGLIADDKDEVGPLFDWYANGVVWTLPGTDNEVRSTRASADLMRSHYRDAAVVVGRRLFDFVKGWNDARARFGKGVI